MLRQLVHKLIRFLARWISRPSTSSLILWLLRNPPLVLLFPTKQPKIHPHTPSPPSGSSNDTIAFSLFQPVVSNGEPRTSNPMTERLPPLDLDIERGADAISQLTTSPDEMSPPQRISILLTSDDGTSYDIDSPNHSRARDTRVTSQSTPHFSPPITSQGSPPEISHTSSYSARSRSGTFHHPTMTISPTMPRGKIQLPSTAVSLTASRQAKIDWVRPPPPQTIRSPPRLSHHLSSQRISPVHPTALGRGNRRVLVV